MSLFYRPQTLNSAPAHAVGAQDSSDGGCQLFENSMHLCNILGESAAAGAATCVAAEKTINAVAQAEHHVAVDSAVKYLPKPELVGPQADATLHTTPHAVGDASLKSMTLGGDKLMSAGDQIHNLMDFAWKMADPLGFLSALLDFLKALFTAGIEASADVMDTFGQIELYNIGTVEATLEAAKKLAS